MNVSHILKFILAAGVTLLLVIDCCRGKKTAHMSSNPCLQERDSSACGATDSTTINKPRWVTIENFDKEYDGMYMPEEDFEVLKIRLADKHQQDSLARVISRRVGRKLRVKNLLNDTYTDGTVVWYWNRFWEDAVRVPSGASVDTYTNFSWQVPHGTCIHKDVARGEVTIYVYAAEQTVYLTDEEFRQDAAISEVRSRDLESHKISYLYGTFEHCGRADKYQYYIVEGKVRDKKQGFWGKSVRLHPATH